MDLSKRAPIAIGERFRIASDLQAMLLDETFRATRWKMGDAVFHGGTSLRVAWASERFSEDLDFMVANSALGALDVAAPRVADRIRHRVSAMLPGSVIEMKAKVGTPGPDRLDVWELKWTHPKRIGKVMVKMEFYEVVDALLRDYGARMILPVADGRGGIRITTPFPVAEMAALWGDKVKAIATRPAFKHRDAYDLAFIVDRLTLNGEMPGDDVLTDTLLRAIAIYGCRPEQVADGLRTRLEDGSLDDAQTFRGNMERWFHRETFEMSDERGMFEDMLRSARAEVERGSELLMAHLNPAPAFGHGR